MAGMARASEVQFLSLNQDHSCFAYGTETGFRAFNIEPLAQLFHQEIPDCGGIGQVYMLNRTNMFAIVGNGKHMKYPRNKVFIWDAKLGEAVLEYTFGAHVLAVRLCSDLIVVVTRLRIYGCGFPHDAESSPALEWQTRENPRAICELAVSLDNKWCAFPAMKQGSIQLVDFDSRSSATRSSTPCIINAHQHEIAAVALNRLGTMVATASTKGTLLRVFDVKTKRQIIELRRGADQAALYCINFSADSAYLCAASDKGTVHIFALKDPSQNRRSTLSKVGYFGQYAESQWGVAQFSVKAECPCICAFAPVGASVMAISYSGAFYKYVFTSDGNCNREAFDMFVDMGDESDDR